MVSNITPISLEKNGQKLNGEQFKTTLLLATLLSISVLAGCGGGGGGSDNAATTTDTSGTTTTTTNNTGSTTTNTGTNTNTGNTGSTGTTTGTGTGTTTGTGTGTTTTTAKTFTKLDKDGGDVTAGIESVACVKDSQTGKYWEVKTDEPAGQTMKGETYQDKDYGYFWYDGKAGVPGYAAGTAVTASLLSGFPCQKTTGLAQCDTGSYIAAVNAAKLCGFKDNGWRLPTKDELLSLIDKSKTSAPYTYTDLGSTSYDPEAKDQLVRGYWSSTASTAAPTTNRLAVSFTGKDDNRVQDHPMGNLINDYIRLIHD